MFKKYYFVKTKKPKRVYYLIYPLTAYELAYGSAINQGGRANASPYLSFPPPTVHPALPCSRRSSDLSSICNGLSVRAGICAMVVACSFHSFYIWKPAGVKHLA